MLGYCRNIMNIFTPRQQTVPLRQGANEVFREMTKCHFVPHEGSTTQCDAEPARDWIIREQCPITLPLDYRWLRAMISQSFA